VRRQEVSPPFFRKDERDTQKRIRGKSFLSSTKQLNNSKRKKQKKGKSRQNNKKENEVSSRFQVLRRRRWKRTKIKRMMRFLIKKFHKRMKEL
jgi:hypothetical protein